MARFPSSVPVPILQVRGIAVLPKRVQPNSSSSRGSYKQYSPGALTSAVAAVRGGQMSTIEASLKFGVPLSTLKKRRLAAESKTLKKARDVYMMKWS